MNQGQPDIEVERSLQEPIYGDLKRVVIVCKDNPKPKFFKPALAGLVIPVQGL